VVYSTASFTEPRRAAGGPEPSLVADIKQLRQRVITSPTKGAAPEYPVDDKISISQIAKVDNSRIAHERILAAMGSSSLYVLDQSGIWALRRKQC
jgi:hypothetical protein